MGKILVTKAVIMAASEILCGKSCQRTRASMVQVTYHGQLAQAVQGGLGETCLRMQGRALASEWACIPIGIMEISVKQVGAGTPHTLTGITATEI